VEARREEEEDFKAPIHWWLTRRGVGRSAFAEGSDRDAEEEVGDGQDQVDRALVAAARPDNRRQATGNRRQAIESAEHQLWCGLASYCALTTRIV
jgi:hypothetical protein